jgi:hypothetical protein
MGVSPPSEVLSGAFNENLFDSVVNIAVASQVTANARIILRNYIREINRLGGKVVYVRPTQFIQTFSFPLI